MYRALCVFGVIVQSNVLKIQHGGLQIIYSSLLYIFSVFIHASLLFRYCRCTTGSFLGRQGMTSTKEEEQERSPYPFRWLGVWQNIEEVEESGHSPQARIIWCLIGTAKRRVNRNFGQTYADRAGTIMGVGSSLVLYEGGR